jgi:hypothetical protein
MPNADRSGRRVLHFPEYEPGHEPEQPQGADDDLVISASSESPTWAMVNRAMCALLHRGSYPRHRHGQTSRRADGTVNRVGAHPPRGAHAGAADPP